jgi:tripartite-type tricarboxylate transporter receptor subunit TctC
MRRRALPALAASLCLPAIHLHAQGAWPTKAVRIVVSFPPGGSSDIAARVLADHYSQAMGQRFVVDNRAGAAAV